MEIARYRPGQAIRWLQVGANQNKKDAADRGKIVLNSPTGPDNFLKNVKNVAGVILDLGKSAYANTLHSRASDTEYVLMDDHLDVVRSLQIRSIAYKEIRTITQKGDRTIITQEKIRTIIKPTAYIVSGTLKVPIGWDRNGSEVPYQLLVEELCARCGVDLDEE